MLGYMTLLSACFAYFTLPLIPFPAIVRWVSLGVHFTALKLPSLLWAFSVKTCKTLQRQTSFPAIVQWVSLGFYFIKDSFVLCTKIGVLPWIIGCWLEICTSPLFGTGFFQIFETLSDLPSMTTLRWLSGILCLLVAESFMKRIQEVTGLNFAFFLICFFSFPLLIFLPSFGRSFINEPFGISWMSQIQTTRSPK